MLVFPSVLCNYFYVFINCCFGSSIEALPSLVHSNSKISKVWQRIDCSYAVGLSRLGLDLYFRALYKQLSELLWRQGKQGLSSCGARDGTCDSVLVLTAEEFCCSFSEDNNHA